MDGASKLDIGLFCGLKQWLIHKALLGLALGTAVMCGIFFVPYLLGGPYYPCSGSQPNTGDCPLDIRFDCATNLSTLWPFEAAVIGISVLSLAVIMRLFSERSAVLQCGVSLVGITGSTLLCLATISATLRSESEVVFLDDQGRETQEDMRPSFASTVQCLVTGIAPYPGP